MPESSPAPVPAARAVSPKRTRISLVWIVPIVAALAGVWVAAVKIMSEGPKITITFSTAEGLEAGKTTIHYNGVVVGTLDTIRLSEDHQRVVATARMAPKTDDFLVDDTAFWVVSPRISGATVTGLGTLISGAYIGMEIGKSKTRKRDFVALEAPPVVSADVPGRYFTLKTPDLGSLDYGTPLFFRRLKVGEVTQYKLDEDGQSLTVQVFVNAPYDKYVTADTRFWQASGIDMSLTAGGLSVQTQSVLSILIGGIALETPEAGRALPAAEANRVFPLFPTRSQAFQAPIHNPQTYVLVFNSSVRGLTPGAPVLFRGIQIGEVVDVHAQVDPRSFSFTVPVTIHVDPVRLGVQVVGPVDEIDPAQRRRLLDALVAHGVRAQLQTGSLLTGQLFVAVDFFPDAAPATIDWSQTPPQFPTVPGEVEALEASIASIIKKLDALPLQAIGEDLKKSIAELDRTLVSARGTLDNADKLIAPGSPLGAQLANTLQEFDRAARGLRVLADYLERHPEALIKGKSGGPE